MTAVALRARPRHAPPAPARRHDVSPIPLPIPLPIERLLFMCDVARERERRGEPAAAFHGFCRGRATSPARFLPRLPDPDGRFSPGRHVCTCACHATVAGPSTGSL
jgi:hypothetical protein